MTKSKRVNAAADAPKPSAVDGSKRRGEPQSALVVDDDEFVRKVLARQLTSLGIGRVESAEDGAQACERLGSHGPFDLMTCDLQMPGTDGIELLRKISEIQPDLAVILVSSMDRRVLSTAEALAGSRKVSILGVLQKPVSIDAIRGLLHQWRPPRTPVAADALAGPAISAETLSAAIRDDEIDIFVQPQVELETRQLVGVEALARWLSPSLGVIGADHFVKLAEQSDLIDQLTELICHKAMKASADWRSQGLETRVSVNLTARCIERVDLPERLTAMSLAFGVAASQFQLEITESSEIKDLTTSLDVMTRLRMRNFALSLDDFGTGYSSLTQLKRIPFTELKLDRSFVGAAAHDLDARRIIESNVKLARSFGMKTVAEGVETAADWDTMKTLGCDIVQGYLIARPMPAHKLVSWAAAYSRR